MAATTPPSIKDTIASIIIAFVLAFVFRAFVGEAFVIPTGSMAPTLLGAHMRFQSPQSGYDWAVGPWDYIDKEGKKPSPWQGVNRPIRVHDPMTGFEMTEPRVRRKSGDRIFVMKYLFSVFDPARFDIVVFKNPNDPTENYIKRLIGKPGEQVALIDGDVFARRAPERPESNPWLGSGWSIARKPDRVQRGLWLPVSNNFYAPLKPDRDGRPWYHAPWSGRGWNTEGQTYRFEGDDPATLAWDDEHWPITDVYPYNENIRSQGSSRFNPDGSADYLITVYPVSDLAMSAGVCPERAGVSVSAIVETRGHEFRADISGETATLRMRPLHGGEGQWTTLDEARIGDRLRPGRVTNVEFWHVDQALHLFIDGRRVAGGASRGAYDWSPDDRVKNTFGVDMSLGPIEDVLAEGLNDGESAYPIPKIRWEFSGSPVTLHRVTLARDVHYQAASQTRGTLRAGSPGRTLTLSPSQFFVCGDNSPQSFDARMWEQPDRWVAAQIDPTAGVVPRTLMIGKAFFVYFPSLQYRFGLPVPDFGRMRFLR